MTELEWQEIERQVKEYDCERSRGLVHDRGYSIKMEQYRSALYTHNQ